MGELRTAHTKLVNSKIKSNHFQVRLNHFKRFIVAIPNKQIVCPKNILFFFRMQNLCTDLKISITNKLKLIQIKNN